MKSRHSRPLGGMSGGLPGGGRARAPRWVAGAWLSDSMPISPCRFPPWRIPRQNRDNRPILAAGPEFAALGDESETILEFPRWFSLAVSYSAEAATAEGVAAEAQGAFGVLFGGVGNPAGDAG